MYNNLANSTNISEANLICNDILSQIEKGEDLYKVNKLIPELYDKLSQIYIGPAASFDDLYFAGTLSEFFTLHCNSENEDQIKILKSKILLIIDKLADVKKYIV